MLKGIEAMIDVQRIVKATIEQSIPQTSCRYLKIFDIWFKAI